MNKTPLKCTSCKPHLIAEPMSSYGHPRRLCLLARPYVEDKFLWRIPPQPVTVNGLSPQRTTPNVAARATNKVPNVWPILWCRSYSGHVVASKVNCHFCELDEGLHFSTVRPRLACCELSTHKSWLAWRSIESSNRHFYKYVQIILIPTLLREMQQVHIYE